MVSKSDNTNKRNAKMDHAAIYDLYTTSIIILVLFIIFLVFFISRGEPIVSKTTGWSFILIGFYFIFFSRVYHLTRSVVLFVSDGFFIGRELSTFIEDFSILFGAFSIAVGVIKWVPKIVEYEKGLLSKLSEKGFVVYVCSSCNNVLYEDGTWIDFEDYIKVSKEKEVQSCLCPTCVAKRSST